MTRRYPNFVAFIVTGAVAGAVVGGLISIFSGNPSTTFSESSALMFMALAFGLLGAAVGAFAGVIADMIMERRVR